MTEQIVWKVVSLYKDNDTTEHMYSANHGIPPLGLEYFIGQKTFPIIKHSYIFSFQSLGDARMFLVNSVPRMRVLRCVADVIYTGPIKIPQCPDIITQAKGEIEAQKFWNFMSTGASWKDYMGSFEYPDDTCHSLRMIPEGTIFCNWVLPIEEN